LFVGSIGGFEPERRITFQGLGERMEAADRLSRDSKRKVAKKKTEKKPQKSCTATKGKSKRISNFGHHPQCKTPAHRKDWGRGERESTANLGRSRTTELRT